MVWHLYCSVAMRSCQRDDMGAQNDLTLLIPNMSHVKIPAINTALPWLLGNKRVEFEVDHMNST